VERVKALLTQGRHSWLIVAVSALIVGGLVGGLSGLWAGSRRSTSDVSRGAPIDAGTRPVEVLPRETNSLAPSATSAASATGVASGGEGSGSGSWTPAPPASSSPTPSRIKVTRSPGTKPYIEVSGPTIYGDYPSDARIFTRPEAHCEHLGTYGPVAIRVLSIGMQTVEGPGGFERLTERPQPCTGRDEAAGTPDCVGAVLGPTPFVSPVTDVCRLAIRLNGAGVNHITRVTMTLESRCTSREAQQCDDHRLRTEPTPENPVTVRWFYSYRVVGCLAVARPTDGEFWQEETRGRCPDVPVPTESAESQP
jgi:hypothetical protein